MPTTSHSKYPAFPSDLPTAPLVSISLSKLESGDQSESEAFYQASKDLGFFYLSTEGSALGDKLVEGAEKLHQLEEEFFSLSNDVKAEFARPKIDKFFGYSFVPSDEKNEDGTQRRSETYNMRKDDIVGNCDPLPAPPLIKSHQPLLLEYTKSCRSVIDLLISHLEKHLQLPKGTLASLHRINHRSGDHVRFNQSAIQPFSEERARMGEHTDFGTLTILFNWLGGLQIRKPETTEWVWVKPVPGSAVVNLGDALVKFTAGILRSNIHRVVPAPPPQDKLLRNSLVYFSRPEDAVMLKRLKGGLIDAQPHREGDDEEINSYDWIIRRSVGDLRGVYTHKGGLEHRPSVYV